MSKAWRWALLVLGMYAGLTALHLWLNVGLDKIPFLRGMKAHASYRVGYLPVT